jgi:hypothetical protein
MTRFQFRPTACLLGLALALAAFGFSTAASAAPDPLSDADGDGIPYKWETPEAQASPPQGGSAGGGSAGATGTSPVQGKCSSKQQLRKGHCVPKCKKGKKLKGHKCVKKGKKKPAQRGREAIARAMAATTSVAPLGANPDHKDIFVEVDYASAALRQNVACSELDAIVAAFAAAPVSNPDGQTGIDLHIDAGIACPSRSYDLGGSRVFSAGACPSAGATLQSIELPESRAGTFHIAGFSPTCGGGGGEGGAGALHGVKMAIFTDGFSFAHVLMHELGHNLGLDHPILSQPNRISTMNTRLFASNTGNSATEVLDYQRISLPALDENNLSEVTGISAPAAAHRFYILHFCEGAGPGQGTYPSAWPGDGPIDWNCNTPGPFDPPTIDLPTVSADVNGDGQKTVFPATGDEWVTLDYASGGKIGP